MKSLQTLLGNTTIRKKALPIVNGLLITAGWAVDFFWSSAWSFNALMLLATLTAAGGPDKGCGTMSISNTDFSS